MAVGLSKSDSEIAVRTGAEPRPLVLVTDDNGDIRLLLRTALEIRGWSVIEACDGEEAVQLAESALPDVILMDTKLPRLDGLAATRRIRELKLNPSIPIVIISGHAEPAFRMVAREAGCDEFLVKPINLEHLNGVIEKHLYRDA